MYLKRKVIDADVSNSGSKNKFKMNSEVIQIELVSYCDQVQNQFLIFVFVLPYN